MRFNGWSALIGRFASLAAMFAASATMRAQSGRPRQAGGDMFYRAIGPGSGPDDVIGFVGFEAWLGRKTITGAPFSATYSQQTTQTLADGNHIQRAATGTLARDSSGRTHRDLTLPAIGEWATSGKPRRT